MKLKEKIVVLAGGTGAVGEGMAKVFLEEGATVVIPTRSQEKETRIKKFLEPGNQGLLVTLPADVSSSDQAIQLKEQVLEQFGRIDLAIASIGGWHMGFDLADMPFDFWMKIMNDNLNSHFIFARTFIPVLRDQNEGIYININGAAQDYIMPKSGGMTIISAAQNRMTEVLDKEASGKGYRIRSVAAYTPVKTRARGNQVEDDWVSAEDIGHYIVRLYNREISDDPVTHKLYGGTK